jgi:pimeloyl-ACP methyl ester carboxylesterase
MTEVCCQFGEHDRLAGIVTQPAAAAARGLCVLVNAGMVAKSGPWRLYVEVARQLAHAGVATLRFDLGGIGDSRREQSDGPLRERTALEIRAAVDELARQHPDGRGVIVGGVCSGAEDALRYAEQDPRVTGVVLIDPFSYRTTGWRWRHAAFRATRRALRAVGIYEPIAAPDADAEAGTGAAAAPRRVVSYKYMEHAESSRILKALFARRARLLFIYTGGQHDSFNHAGQLQQMFPDLPFEDRVAVEFFAHMDHTQAFASDRKEVVAAIERSVDAWLAR